MMPLQTDSKNAHIRGWGCFASCLISFLDIDLTAEKVERIISGATRVVMRDGLPLIRDDNATIDYRKPDSWWRMFVRDDCGFVEFAGEYAGRRVKCHKIGSSRWMEIPTGTTHILCEKKTKTGSHFIRVDNQANVIYNPDTKVFMTGIIGFRYYKVEVC